MTLPRVSTLVIIAALLALLSQPARPESAARAAPSHQESSAILVKFKAGIDRSAMSRVLSAIAAAQAKEIPGIGILRVPVQSGQQVAALAQLRARPDVEYAEPNYVRQLFAAPSDTYYHYQWHLPRIGADKAWDLTKGSSNVLVAVIDSGFDVGHPDAPTQLILGPNYSSGDVSSPPTVSGDGVGHGTHVAGIVAAAQNGIGVAGVAPGVSVLAIQVCDALGYCYDDAVIAGIRYAADSGAKVINLSLGGDQDSQALHDAITYAANKGALIVAAAGNYYQNGNPIIYPAAYPTTLAVGATTCTDQRAYYSEVHPYVGIAAPGGSFESCNGNQNDGMILSLAPPKMYAYKAGTSMATPVVSGVAGLVFSAKPSLSAPSVREILESTAIDLGAPGPDSEYGAGLVNACRAVNQVNSQAASLQSITPAATLTYTLYLPLVSSGDMPICS